jgi:hypothetical protein
VNCASTDLWGAWVGNHPGLPGVLFSKNRTDTAFSHRAAAVSQRSACETDPGSRHPDRHPGSSTRKVSVDQGERAARSGRDEAMRCEARLALLEE